MTPRAREIVEQLKKLHPTNEYQAVHSSARESSLLGELFVILAEEQEKASVTMERQTNKLIRLTWGLFCLTVVLAIVAAVQLCIMLK